MDVLTRPDLKNPLCFPCTMYSEMEVDWQEFVDTAFMGALSFMPGSSHGGGLLVELTLTSATRIRP